MKTAFVYDPRISSFRPEVEVDDGVVRLTGTVSNLKAKRTAEQVARHTTGVQRVENELKVEPREPRADEELARVLRRSYEGSAFLDADEIEVAVDGGKVTLAGTVESRFDRWNAEDTAARVAGVAAVENNLKVRDQNAVVTDYHYYPTADSSAPWFHEGGGLVPAKSDEQLQTDVRRQLVWSPFADADEITVTAHAGTVTLTGEVDHWIERDAAIESAYQAGARTVVDRLQLASQVGARTAE